MPPKRAASVAANDDQVVADQNHPESDEEIDQVNTNKRKGREINC